MIKNIVFDIGNVLAGFEWETFFKSFHYSEEVYNKMAKATVHADFWKELDRGILEEDELLAGFIHNDPSIEQEIRATFRNVTGIISRYDYAIPWIREWKEKGYGIYYISNFSKKIHRECIDSLDFLPEMSGGILSYQVKMIKPSPDIYRLFLHNYGLRAEDCVFLDDTPVNVEAAKKEGMKGIIFHTREQASMELEQLLGIV